MREGTLSFRPNSTTRILLETGYLDALDNRSLDIPFTVPSFVSITHSFLSLISTKKGDIREYVLYTI